MMKVLIVQLFLLFFPWKLRRFFLVHFLKMKLGTNTKIGFSLVLAKKVVLEDNSQIGNLTFINAIDLLHLKEYSKIGRRNWITGISATSKAYPHSQLRNCEFIIGKHTRITDRHYVDCNGGIYIGDYSTIAGIGTQILSHGIDIIASQQKTNSVNIGSFCFVGTKCIFLMNSAIPDYCVVGAGSVVAKKFTDTYTLYAGVPAKVTKELPRDANYFTRSHGNVE